MRGLSSLPQNIPDFYRVHREIFKKYNDFSLFKSKKSGNNSDNEGQSHFDSWVACACLAVLFVLGMIESVGIIERDNRISNTDFTSKLLNYIVFLFEKSSRSIKLEINIENSSNFAIDPILIWVKAKLL